MRIDGQAGSSRQLLGEDAGLIEPARQQSQAAERHRNHHVDADNQVAPGLGQPAPEERPRIVPVGVLEVVDEVRMAPL